MADVAPADRPEPAIAFPFTWVDWVWRRTLRLRWFFVLLVLALCWSFASIKVGGTVAGFTEDGLNLALLVGALLTALAALILFSEWRQPLTRAPVPPREGTWAWTLFAASILVLAALSAAYSQLDDLVRAFHDPGRA